ncbi:MAG: AAA family ATPase [Myxococcota bacterium]|nr:AAA family ATPase [Myxococcota bacterium]
MKSRGASGNGTRADERLRIKSGRLGPLQPYDFEIRPLTVLVGRQGTGKSLLAQVLYFFRGLPTLVQFDLAGRRADEPLVDDPSAVIRRVLDGLRSARRSFATMTEPRVTVEWSGWLSVGSAHSERRELGFNTQHVTRQVQPRKGLRELVQRMTTGVIDQPPTGIFVPSERLLYSMALGTMSWKVLASPLILDVFAREMETAERVQDGWPHGKPDTQDGRWVSSRLGEALGGEARRIGATWKWNFPDAGGSRSIDLDMASSGQRANWPLLLLPQVLFSRRSRGELADRFTLFVEEPEIHLHPEAQRVVVEVLAFLVRRNFRVVITTHSLNVLYVLNNLLLASKLPSRKAADEVPEEIRLDPGLVAAYHLQLDGAVQPLHSDAGEGLDERALGAAVDDLAAQMNRMSALVGRGRSR